ncbi:MAG TPA: hypothetical protein VMN37_04825 [Gemmatimonadales bacterium]|nr:hypothetical protein [Gemmatimonadales bacterium]
MRHVAGVLLGAVVVAGAACGGREEEHTAGSETGAAAESVAAPAPESRELEVAGVMIGKRIGENNLITEPTFQFQPLDTVYVSIATTGVPDSASLAALWHFQTGRVVDSSARTIRPEGPENTEFHVFRPKGWPVGTYKVTIYADGDSVDARTFAVRDQ